MKLKGLIVGLVICLTAFGKENSDFDYLTLDWVKQRDGTYSFYVKELSNIEIYRSKKIYFKFDKYQKGKEWRDQCQCGNKNIYGIGFTYQKYPKKHHGDERDGAYESVFLNVETREISPPYPFLTFVTLANGMYNCYSILCAPQAHVIAEGDNGIRNPSIVVLHPIFKSQPKVWLIIQRQFGKYAEFPTFVSSDYRGFVASSSFNAEGVLDLVTDVIPIDIADIKVKRETIPVDYSIFTKPVDKPTCYTIPEDHKLRLCTPEEAKLRSPGLKVFLGENN